MNTPAEQPADPIDQVDQWIPHRPPFRYIDRIISGDDQSMVAEVTVRDDEPWCSGHFPGNPIMPGVLVLECIFQTGALFLSKRIHDERAATEPAAPPPGVPVMTRIGGAKFRKVVRPGDVLRLEVKLDDRAANAFRLSGSASIDGKKAATVEFTCALVDADSV